MNSTSISLGKQNHNLLA